MRLFQMCFVLMGLLLFADAAFAKQYRCYGRVQYRPCTEEDAQRSPLPHQNRSALRSMRSKNSGSVKILSADFQKLNKRTGLWKGERKGDGMTELFLLIRSGEKIVEERYMGKVELAREEGNVTFHFKSPLPHYSFQSWTVVARAKS